MWSNNKTSEWLDDMPSLKKSEILKDARRSAPQMMEAFRERQKALYQKKLTLINTRRDKKVAQENKQYTNKVKLTAKLHDIGGLWLSQEDIEIYKTKVDNNKNCIKEAIITQLNFRRSVLGSKGQKELFQQSTKGTQYTLEQLESNLMQIIHTNLDQEVTDNTENQTLHYKPITEAQENISKAKQSFAAKLSENREKITIQQQLTLLPSFIAKPETLVNKTINHKFKDIASNEISWYKGKVLSVKKLSGRHTKYEVHYEGEDDTCIFPLLIDMGKGDLMLLDA